MKINEKQMNMYSSFLDAIFSFKVHAILDIIQISLWESMAHLQGVQDIINIIKIIHGLTIE